MFRSPAPSGFTLHRRDAWGDPGTPAYVLLFHFYPHFFRDPPTPCKRLQEILNIVLRILRGLGTEMRHFISHSILENSKLVAVMSGGSKCLKTSSAFHTERSWGCITLAPLSHYIPLLLNGLWRASNGLYLHIKAQGF